MIIFGTRGKAAIIGHVTMTCPFCANTCAQTFQQARRHLTLFFVPLIPISTTNALICTACGRGHKIDKAQADRLKAYFAGLLPAGQARPGQARVSGQPSVSWDTHTGLPPALPPSPPPPSGQPPA